MPEGASGVFDGRTHNNYPSASWQVVWAWDSKEVWRWQNLFLQGAIFMNIFKVVVKTKKFKQETKKFSKEPTKSSIFMTEKEEKTWEFSTLKKINKNLWMKLGMYTCSYPQHPAVATKNIEVILVKTSTLLTRDQYSWCKGNLHL